MLLAYCPHCEILFESRHTAESMRALVQLTKKHETCPVCKSHDAGPADKITEFNADELTLKLSAPNANVPTLARLHNMLKNALDNNSEVKTLMTEDKVNFIRQFADLVPADNQQQRKSISLILVF